MEPHKHAPHKCPYPSYLQITPLAPVMELRDYAPFRALAEY
jgi:hypothetical protein